MDRLSLTEALLCLGSRSGEFLSDYQAEHSSACVNPCTGANAPPSHDEFRRNLGISHYWGEYGPDGEPSVGMYSIT